MADEKPKFTTDISQAAIEAALASVEKAKRRPEGEDPEVAALRGEVEQLQAQLNLSQTKARETLEKLKEEHDRVLRAAADLDNQKKRAQREKEESLKFGLERFLKELLPVADNLERAISHAEGADKESLLQGVKMTAKLMDDILGRQGVKSFSAKGEVFDPRVHEAMQQVETEGPSNMVAEELLRGYTLNDRLVRPALVSVSRQKTSPVAPEPAPQAEPVPDSDPTSRD